MTPRILVIDDNAVTRAMVRTALDEDHTLVEAVDAASGLSAAREQTPDLVLVDLVLPDGDGFELALRLRALAGMESVPLLALAGVLSAAEEARLAAAPFDDTITKPVDAAQLRRVIDVQLRAHGNVSRPQSAEGRTVILVDDDPRQRKLAEFRLRALGLRVITAADGQEALDAARGTHPDVILSDVMMPVLDGFQLCAAVRADRALNRVPVVLLTSSYLDDSDRRLAEQAGATAMVVRTPDLRDAIDALERCLSGQLRVSGVQLAPDVLQQEHLSRLMRQLDRQVALHAGVNQRCTRMGAELSVLRGISDALLGNNNVEEALDHVLSAWFDAAGIPSGALFLLTEDGAFTVRRGDGRAAQRLQDEPRLLRAVLQDGRLATLNAPSSGDAQVLLEGAGLQSAVLLPLLRGQQPLGVLLVGAPGPRAYSEEWLAFAQSVANQITQALALARAFDARARSEEQARTQAAALKAVVESVAEGVAVADEHGRIILWNSAAERMLPIDGEGRPDVGATATAADADPVRQPLAHAVRGEVVGTTEVYLRQPGTPSGRWLSFNARPLRFEDGAHRGGVAVFRDVTEEKATQAHLLASDRMASVGLLAAGVAHEINNPLSAVKVNLELALQEVEALAGRGMVPQDLLEELSDAMSAAERVREIVRDIKLFSRAGTEQLHRVDVHQVMDSSLRMAWNEIRHRARLVKDYGTIQPVKASDSRLGQVFLNIVMNAVQAMGEGRADANELRVRTAMRDSLVTIEITDTGPGMEASVRERLFTPFFTTKPVGVGTGLGLSICQRIITGLGGGIEVDSEVGRGTTFRVLLPPAADAVPAPTREAIRASPSPKRGRVLIIDDDPLIASAIQRILGREHAVRCTTSGRDALALVSSGERFDLILCDMMMPHWNGQDVHRELGRVAPELVGRMVFLTGGAFTDSAMRFLASVDLPRLEKPFDASRLRTLVSEQLSRW